MSEPTISDTAAAAASKKSKDQVVVNKAYTAGLRHLKDKYSEEFIDFVTAECKKAGVTYKPRRSKEQAAVEQIRKLLTDNPELVERLRSELTPAVTEDTAAAVKG